MASERETTAEIEALKRQLAEKDLAIKELEAGNRLLAEGSGSEQGQFSRDARSVGGAGKKKWKHLVSCPTHKEPPLEPKEITAVDESEAVRVFILTALPNGKVIDVAKHRVVARCLESKERAEFGKKHRAKRNAEKGYPELSIPKVGAAA